VEIDEAGFALITQFEGFVPYLYDDPLNATVAIGILVHRGPYHWDRGVCAECDQWPRQHEPESTWLTDAQGAALLNDKANARGQFAGGQDYAGAVRVAFPDVNQNQLNAMCSYSYNYGSGAVARMAKAHYGGQDMHAAFTDPRYLLPAQFHDGLLRRREAEYQLFSTPVTAPPIPAPTEEEEDDMKPLVVWNTDLKTVQLITGWASPITIGDAGEVASLEKVYGAQIALSNGTIQQMKPA